MGKHIAVRFAAWAIFYLVISVAICALSNALFDSVTWQFWAFDLTLCFVAGFGVALFQARRRHVSIDSTKEAA